MSAVDAVDFVDMLEKHGFSRTEAKMFIDFNQARLATKDDLNVVNINLSNKIDSVEQKLDSKIEAVEQRLEAKIEKEISKSSLNQIKWMFGMFITFFGLNSGFVYFLLRAVIFR